MEILGFRYSFRLWCTPIGTEAFHRAEKGGVYKYLDIYFFGFRIAKLHRVILSS